jgi:pimeloyl-ACP methyl ester carboxylesterase
VDEPHPEHAPLFAVDLPGFGASERRADLLSPRAMGAFLARLVAEARLGTPHIVAPDVGTSAALFAAAAHPEVLASVIVGTGGAAVPLQLAEPLASWVLDPDLDTFLPSDRNAKLADEIGATGKNLTHIYITHGQTTSSASSR